jgi:lipopolysaccharide/colanic/teichoic acid biosynthesis glycosyltransferase
LIKKCEVTRLFDIIFSLSAIVALTPILVPCVIILRLTGEGRVFFKQIRIGRHQKKFGLIKFATMLENSQNLGSGTITIKDDPRILPFGKLLRKSKVNELPQLLNVLIGDMSLIGPRPLTLETFEYYKENEKFLIGAMRPGLSGVGSIFFSNEEELIKSKDPKLIRDYYANQIAPRKAACEIWFSRHCSTLLYLKLIILTILVVVFRIKQPIHFLSKDLQTSLEKLDEKFSS